MMKPITFFSILCFISSSFLYGQTQDCTVLKDSRLKYLINRDTTAYVVIKNDKHIEYLRSGKYYIKSDLKWLNDCEYEATMTEITLPNFPFKPGQVMHVKFIKIQDQIVEGIATVNGKQFPTKFKIMN